MPDLIIIAGCNGAGKSTFSSSFLPEGLTSFDYDRLFLENYNSLPDSELRETFARNQTTKDFESIHILYIGHRNLEKADTKST
jgi:predicted ABC-type ATPase